MLQWCIAVRIAIALPQWLSCHVLRCSRVAVGQLHVVPLMLWVAVVTMVWLSLGCACAQHNERKKKTSTTYTAHVGAPSHFAAYVAMSPWHGGYWDLHTEHVSLEG